MKYFSIEFHGRYPVGALAVVEAEDAEQALILFQVQLSKSMPELVKYNKDLSIDDVQELDFRKQDCYILLDGDY